MDVVFLPPVMYRTGGTYKLAEAFYYFPAPGSGLWLWLVEASDWPEGQEHAAQAVGGQEALHRVNF